MLWAATVSLCPDAVTEKESEKESSYRVLHLPQHDEDRKGLNAHGPEAGRGVGLHRGPSGTCSTRAPEHLLTRVHGPKS